MADQRVVDSIARSPVDAQFKQSSTQGFAICEIPPRNAIDPVCDSGARILIRQLRQPLGEHIDSSPVNVMANFHRKEMVTYKSQRNKSKRKPLTTPHSPSYN